MSGHHAWRRALIARLCQLLAPRHILLAGAAEEALCLALAEAARDCGALLHVAVRVPPPWLATLREPFGDSLMIHAAPSADAIGVIPVPGLAWVDEDANWFTVHTALEALLAQATRLNQPFPVTLVSGTGWPNGRRDAYTDPTAIPDGFRHPHQRAGVLPGQASPGAGGLFAGTFHATTENEPRNGVLTAVEDVVIGRSTLLRLAHLPGFGGLAALTPRSGPGAEAFAPATLAADLTGLATALEAARLHNEVALLHAEEARAAAVALAALRAAAMPAPPAAVPSPPAAEPATEGEAHDLATLRASPLFDAAWYLSTNADVAHSGADPALHYLRHGAAERRDPNPFFSTGYYLDAYADVAALHLNPVLHYLSNGAAEGRNPGPRFATRLYVEAHPEVSATNALVHFLTVGLPGGWRAPGVPS